MHIYPNLPNKRAGLNKRAGVQFIQKLTNRLGSSLPCNKVEVHVFSNDYKRAVIQQVCLMKGRSPRVPTNSAERLEKT